MCENVFTKSSRWTHEAGMGSRGRRGHDCVVVVSSSPPPLPASPSHRRCGAVVLPLVPVVSQSRVAISLLLSLVLQDAGGQARGGAHACGQTA